MNIIPPTGYVRLDFPTKVRTQSLNKPISRKPEPALSDRRGHRERRHVNETVLLHREQNPMDLRQQGDRRKSNRLLVTT